MEMPERARALLDTLIAESGENYAKISQLLGKNYAYIQQYIKRGIPTALSAVDQDRLAQHFGQPRNFLRVADGEAGPDECVLALDHIRKAIAICDRAGLDLAACHLQMGYDLLEEHRLSGRRGFTPRADSHGH